MKKIRLWRIVSVCMAAMMVLSNSVLLHAESVNAGDEIKAEKYATSDDHIEMVTISDDEAGQDLAIYDKLKMEPVQTYAGDPPGSNSYQDENGYYHLSWGTIELFAIQFADYVADHSNGSVKVAVIDSGAEMEHPFIRSRIATEEGCDIVNNDNLPEDLVGDGTYIASVIADCTPGLDINILPVKVTENGEEVLIDNIVKGINYAIECDADIIQVACWKDIVDANAADQGIKDINAAIDMALANDIIVVGSAGDENISTTGIYPISGSDIIVVGGISVTPNKYSASNTGDSIDLAAPAVSVKCAAPYAEYSHGYAIASSTKIAAAHITACAAMLKLLYPSYTPAQIENILKACARDLGTAGKDDTYGYGIPELREFITGLPFSDVFASPYYYDGVHELYNRGYMTGQAPDIFSPTLNMQRQDAALLYYRMENTPEVTFAQVYPDVGSADYFAEAAIWARDTGIVTGFANGYLGVGDYITREAFAVTLYRYAQYKGLSTLAIEDISMYKDADLVSDFADQAVKWAVTRNLMGVGTSYLNPQGYIMRQDIAVMIYRFLRVYNL